MTMKIEHLLSTRDFEGTALLERMAIASDILVINQVQDVPEKAYEEFDFKGNRVRVYSYQERGIGISRKRALAHAQGDILLFCDDDMKYRYGYTKIISDTYERMPEADLIFFKVDRIHSGIRPQAHQSYGIRPVKFFNALRYGAINISMRRASVEHMNLDIDERFGSELFKSGEDSVFIADSLSKGAKLYSSSESIASVDLSESSWFRGYNRYYLQNRGAIFYRVSPRYFKVLCAQFALRREDLFGEEYSFSRMMDLMEQGKQVFKRSFEDK